MSGPVRREFPTIIRGGRNNYPARALKHYMRYKAIERATALPVPESRLGEKVCLALMTRQARA
jgi:non-ribosomal peptide synthetase component E (peptide arylation enzyme)